MTSHNNARARCKNDERTILQRLRTYVSRPHAELGRTGPVCPFVPPALHEGALDIILRYEFEGDDPEQLIQLILNELLGFAEKTPTPDQFPPLLHSRAVAFPRIGPHRWSLIDDVYPVLKDSAVENGLMIGQFNPTCEEPAVRNPVFSVSRAPMALYAIRRMAPHDILFLHAKSSWFAQYRVRFTRYYKQNPVRDPLMREFYARAERRYALAETEPAT